MFTQHPLLTSALIALMCATMGCRSEKPPAVDTGTPIDVAQDADGDGYTTDEDCDDNNSVVNPSSLEVCDGVDNDCDGEIDEDVTSTYYHDGDSDGFGDNDDAAEACEPPTGYATIGGDCSDDDPKSYPGAAERCDGVDNDCDGEIDEDVTDTFYADADLDGYGDPDTAVDDCDPPLGYVADGSDCDDTTDTAYPGAEEICDEIDNNCNGQTDEGVTTTWYQDTDDDNFGVSDLTTEACVEPTGYAEQPGDCDDTKEAVNPDAAEICDGIDNDCDGDTDEDDATDASTWYADTDGDGYGDATDSANACAQPSGFVSDSTDCDDGEEDANPGETEVCDGIDNDCDGDADEDDATDASSWYADTDGDGYGDATDSADACAQPTGFVSDSTDCDDGEEDANPGETEVCDGIDNDCDGDTDEDDATDADTWYADTDGDGYGDATDSANACEQPSGFVSDSTDCDDGEEDANPGETEVCDGIDNDCDGDVDDDDDDIDTSDGNTYYTDSDGDGFGDPDASVVACTQGSGLVTDSTDCDDGDADVNPDGEEVCSGKDEDCDGTVDDLGPAAIYAGALSSGTEKLYQYSPVTSGSGYIEANWSSEPAADSYELAVGTTPEGTDVAGWTDVGLYTNATLTGLSLQGAWDDVTYYVSVRAVNDGYSCDLSATSEPLQIAEAEIWDGDVTDLRSPDSRGGYTQNWPESGVDSVYGEHWFEEVDIPSSTAVLVQGWGAEDGVSSGVSASASSVTDPADGWLSLFANDITVSGMITASGRGYGGGGGGGAGVYGGYQGYGGDSGLGGDGGPAATGYAGGGGGGSPGGYGGVGAYTGGDGNLYGGGSGATGCSGSNGRDGGDGSSGTVGGTGGTASSGSPGTAGTGEFSSGGGRGVSGCDNWSGGGGGGYGAGGGGGSQWVSSSAEASGGGGGGTGGTGGSVTVNGGSGAGTYGGSGGTNSGSSTGSPGSDGGYRTSAGNGDSSTDRSLALGSGGGGGSGGYQETGGGGGGAGGGALYLYAWDSLTIESSAYLLANGAGGGGGARDNGGSSTSAVGGVGAGGGILLEAQHLTVNISAPYISAVGGDGQTSNGGTIKLFYDSFSGSAPGSSAAGRVYDAGSGSWDLP